MPQLKILHAVTKTEDPGATTKTRSSQINKTKYSFLIEWKVPYTLPPNTHTHFSALSIPHQVVRWLPSVNPHRHIVVVQSRWCAFFACACSVAQTCPTLCDPVDCNLPNSTARGLFQARLLDWLCHFLLQGIFPNPGSNSHCLCPLRWQADSLPLGHLRCTMAWV